MNRRASRLDLRELGLRSIRELETEHGLLASGKEEIYGCVFGRDSLITSLLLLDVYGKSGDAELARLVKKVLVGLAGLQGSEVNIESGEEPGKCIHEYRPDNHAHLTARAEDPWHVYPDGTMRSYDTVDATPLFLMAAYEYFRLTGDGLTIGLLMPNIHAALEWIERSGDSNGDGLLDYRVHPERRSGGLMTHSWMDSHDSVFFEESDMRPRYPIAPVEAQAYAYAALRAWADYYRIVSPRRSASLASRAAHLKKRFNESFVLQHRGGRVSLAYAIDGVGQVLSSPRSSMGHCLWAGWKREGQMPDIVLDEAYIPSVARRLLQRDLYMRRAGIRTLSSRSKRFDPRSYHNGSIWPHDTAIVATGLANVGFREEARLMRRSLTRAYRHFKTPLELFVYSQGRFSEYRDAGGQGACRTQAWSAASMLAILHEEA